MTQTERVLMYMRDMETSKNRYGEDTSYARYGLVE